MPTERSVKCVYMHGCVCGCVFGWVGVYGVSYIACADQYQ